VTKCQIGLAFVKTKMLCPATLELLHSARPSDRQLRQESDNGDSARSWRTVFVEIDEAVQRRFTIQKT
jgi:hypothetical protein